ncbi:protease [Shewanella phage vB_SbaS_Y11]|nr:protease [Shewanella phage vB_SbaS_Y11]
MSAKRKYSDEMQVLAIAAICVALVVGSIMAVMVVMPYYRVWSQEMRGKAALAEATQSKMIQIEQARAELESSELRAKAIKTIGVAAQKYPEYRHQEFVGAFGEALREGTINQIIYVPTEANIPVLEAGKRPIIED